MTSHAAHIVKAEPGVSHPRTPVEYFEKDEGERSTLSDARAYWHQTPDQGFTFHGHRLSSLYRAYDETRNPLRKSEGPFASSFPKYSHPTPAKIAALGGKA